MSNTPWEQLRRDGIPADLRGKSVLDIGGYDGGMAWLAKARGAAQVTIVDNGQWYCYPGWTSPDYDRLKAAGIEYAQGDFRSWTLPADVVICYNVIYHLEDPLASALALRRLTKEVLCLMTSLIPGDEPVWRIWGPGDPNYAEDVFWKPTILGLERLLLEARFPRLEKVGQEGDHVVYRCYPR